MKDSDGLFETLVRSYAAELYYYAFGLCGDRHQAEDLVQETFLRGWKSLARLRDRCAARGWLYTILKREHARLYRRQRPATTELEDFDIPGRPHYDTSTEAFVLRRAIERLPDAYRDPLLLQVIGGFSCGDIAGILELAPATVMARVSRARRKLREVLVREEKDHLSRSLTP